MKTAIKFLVVVMALLAPTALMAVSEWTPLYEGVEYATGYKESPRLMRAFALRTDLWNSNVSLYATPSNGGAPYETNLQTTPNFLSAYGLKAAINANFFVPSGSYANVEGLLVSNGSYVSYDQAYRQAQLRVTADKVASIVGTGGNPGGLHTAVAGDAYHLVNGTPLGDNSWTAPRTSVGLSQDGRYLIMCVVDGRQPGWSDGATILDMSYWMLDFGAWNAMNLDGGGSSTICTAAQGVLNSPSDGYLRSVGANLGVNSIGISAFPNRMPDRGWYLNNVNTDGSHDIYCEFGTSGDIALAGDWNGDGIVTPGIFRRSNSFKLSNAFDGGVDLSFGFGQSTDIPLVGDWNGDGVDTIGVYRPSSSYFYLNNGFDGTAEYSFHYGTAGDYPVVGDWDGNGTCTIGVRRNNYFYLRNTNSSGSADISQPYGAAYGTPIVGDWDGSGTVTIGIIQ